MLGKKPVSVEEVEKYELQLRLITFRRKLEIARLEEFDFEETFREFKRKTEKERTRAMDVIDSWMRSGKRVLVLSSPPGTGKTFAAALWLYCLWKRAWRKNLKWTFYFFQEKELFGASSLSEEERREIIQDARQATFLVVDDFGQVKPRGEYEEANMRLYYEDLIDWRRKLKKCEGTVPRLILTTNLEIERIKELPYLSNRFWSRIKGIAEYKRIGDRDYRELGFPDFLPSRVKIGKV